MPAKDENETKWTSNEFGSDDAAWAIKCTFLILTMQTGFAMLECGFVSTKNVANIMIKNVVDVCFGGIAFWCFGYALSFGRPSNGFCGMGDFFFTVRNTDRMGAEYTRYFFQFSFATTATTIVSGAVAERIKLKAYMLFSFFNTVVYVIPAGWAWNPNGWLYRINFFDFAGTTIVHLTGGISALVCAALLGPRRGRFTHPNKYEMSSPVTSLTGMFMLWWAWLGFNCGSTFGISGNRWKICALVAVTTLNASIGGGIAGIFITLFHTRGKVLVPCSIQSILGGLISITGIASVTTPTEAVFVGMIGGAVAIVVEKLVFLANIDDPVGAVGCHMGSSIWGTIAVGLFAEDPFGSQILHHGKGLLHGGGLQLLGPQIVGLLAVGLWSGCATLIIIFLIKVTVGFRMSEEDEILGADWVEHHIHSSARVKNLESVLGDLSSAEWNEILQKLSLEIQNVKTSNLESRHRIFSVDVAATTQEDKNQAVAVTAKILSLADPKTINAHLRQRALTHSTQQTNTRIRNKSFSPVKMPGKMIARSQTKPELPNVPRET